MWTRKDLEKYVSDGLSQLGMKMKYMTIEEWQHAQDKQ